MIVGKQEKGVRRYRITDKQFPARASVVENNVLVSVYVCIPCIQY